LEDAPLQLELVIALDRATVVETTDLIEVDGDGGRTQSGLGMRGHVGQARIIAGEKPGEYAGGWCSQTWRDRLQLGYSSGLPLRVIDRKPP
jgi:hypothetical protein